MNPTNSDASQTFKVKYITGHTILSNRPAHFEFYNQNVKVVLDAHKDEPESVLFDVPVSQVERYKSVQMGGRAGANTSATYVVGGTKYSFLSNDGSFNGNLQALDSALGGAGAKIPQAATNSKAQTTVVIVTVVGILIIFAILLLSK